MNRSLFEEIHREKSPLTIVQLCPDVFLQGTREAVPCSDLVMLNLATRLHQRRLQLYVLDFGSS